jgi:hypothetical protein
MGPGGLRLLPSGLYIFARQQKVDAYIFRYTDSALALSLQSAAAGELPAKHGTGDPLQKGSK